MKSIIVIVILATVQIVFAAPTDSPFPNVKALTEETLVTPLKTMPICGMHSEGSYGRLPAPLPVSGESCWSLNADGKGWTRLIFYYHYSFRMPCQVVAINTVTGECRKLTFPDPQPSGGPFTWCLGRDGKTYVTGGPWVWVYDPASGAIKSIESQIQGIGMGRSIAYGLDGKVYVGTHPQAIVFQYDPTTGKIKDLGRQGSKRDYMTYVYTVAADDEYVYSAVGKIPWECIATNLKTGEQKVLFQGEGMIRIMQGRDGCRASQSAATPGGSRQNYWLYHGQAILIKDPNEQPPWGAAREVVKLPDAPEENIDDAVPGTDGQATYWWRSAEARNKAPKNTLPGTSLAQLGWQSVTYQVNVAQDLVHWVHEMPDGRILGVGSAYLDWFIANPTDGRVQILGKIPLSHYATLFVGGKAYMTGYPTTPLYEFDPAKPWTVGNSGLGAPGGEVKTAWPIESPQSNPRRLTYLGTNLGTHHGRAMALGADGRIYVGAHAERSEVGGGLGWWDPKTGKAGGLREPFELYDVAGLCAIDQGRKIVFSSQLVTDPKTEKRADAAQIFVYDTQKQSLNSFVPFPKGVSTGQVLPAPAPGNADCVIGLINPKSGPCILYRADVVKQQVLQTVQVPQRLSNAFRYGPDGMIWSFAGNVLVRINPADLAITPVGSVTAPGAIAFVGKDAYLGGANQLRLLRGLVP